MLETPERLDLPVAVELTDSLEGLRLNAWSEFEGVSDGRRGGNAGEGPEGARGGRDGPFLLSCVDVLGGREGRDMPFVPLEFEPAVGCSTSG